jgi:L-amino acid N-acyltransferase YncA
MAQTPPSAHLHARPRSSGIEVRDATLGDAPGLVDLLNAIIAQGGTTAHEDLFTAERLAETYLVGPDVLCCFVAIDRAIGRLEGFQTLGRYSDLPEDIGDIGTFARIDGKQRGVGSALFAATRERARELGLTAINATIRADNLGGLAFYRKMGFEDHSVTPAKPLKDGRPVDRVNKRFRLTS